MEVLYEVQPDTMDESTARVRVLSHALSAAAHAYTAVEAARERLAEAACPSSATGDNGKGGSGGVTWRRGLRSSSSASFAALGGGAAEEERERWEAERAAVRGRVEAVASVELRDAVERMLRKGADIRAAVLLDPSPVHLAAWSGPVCSLACAAVRSCLRAKPAI